MYDDVIFKALDGLLSTIFSRNENGTLRVEVKSIEKASKGIYASIVRISQAHQVWAFV